MNKASLKRNVVFSLSCATILSLIATLVLAPLFAGPSFALKKEGSAETESERSCVKLVDEQLDSLPAPLPKVVDNSDSKYFPPVGDQGSLGACASFASVYYVSTYMRAQAQDIDVRALGNDAIFSPGFTYEANSVGTGGLAMGLLTLEAWPWNENALEYSKPVAPELWRESFKHRATELLRVEDINTPQGHQKLNQYLADGYIFLLGIREDVPLELVIFDDQNFDLDTIDIDKNNPDSKSHLTTTEEIGNHAMTIVGYHDQIWLDRNNNGIIDAGETGAYKIVNSWGVAWGNEGFAWLPYSEMEKHTDSVETYIYSAEERSVKLLAEFELIGIAERAEFAKNTEPDDPDALVLDFTDDATAGFEDAVYVSYNLGWALHGGEEIIDFEFDGSAACWPTIQGDTFIADFTDIVTMNNLDLEANEYDWYINFAIDDNPKPGAWKLTSLKLTDAEGNVLTEYDGALPATIGGMDNTGSTWTKLKITYGKSDGFTSAPTKLPRAIPQNFLFVVLVGLVALSCLVLTVGIILLVRRKRGK
ncbi:MAG: C1 family peptidase [Coriobacteriia bacterium]|nr:C1 family peptidase [Coriobacteriia bacterium]